MLLGHPVVVRDPAHEIGGVGTGGGEEPSGSSTAGRPRVEEHPADERVAVAHRSQEQARGRAGVLGVAPQPVRGFGRDEERDTRSEAEPSHHHGEQVDRRARRRTLTAHGSIFPPFATPLRYDENLEPMPDDELLSDLTAAELAELDRFGTRRSISAGDVLFAEGDADYDFFVVLSGLVDIIGHFDGADEVMVQHGPGRFLGELAMLTGQRAYLTARVVADGEVLAIPRVDFRRLIATVPGISDKILATFVQRRTMLLEGAARSIRVDRVAVLVGIARHA